MNMGNGFKSRCDALFAKVKNIPHDFGLDVSGMRAGRACIVSGESTKYTELKTDKGTLVVNEKIHREQLCADITPCSFTLKIILDNLIELHHVTMEILYVNDHSPTFPNAEINLDISESVTPGAHFLLGSADDPDVGVNTLQSYILSPNDYFTLKQLSCPDGVKYAEMVLQKPLDREQQLRHLLPLTAADEGNRQRSGNVKINVVVNDSKPAFSQALYTVTIAENSPKGMYITTVNASDADSGANGLVSYSFAYLKGNIGDIFAWNKSTGIITLKDESDAKMF